MHTKRFSSDQLLGHPPKLPLVTRIVQNVVGFDVVGAQEAAQSLKSVPARFPLSHNVVPVRVSGVREGSDNALPGKLSQRQPAPGIQRSQFREIVWNDDIPGCQESTPQGLARHFS
jgi:hypothetical protein